MLIHQFATFEITVDYLQLTIVFFHSEVCVVVSVCASTKITNTQTFNYNC